MKHSYLCCARALLVTACVLIEVNNCHAQVSYFGNYTDLGGNSNHSPHYLLGSRITVNQPVTLLSAGVIYRTSGYMSNIGLYSDSGGFPEQLLATTGAFAVTTTGRVETPFLTQPTLAPGNYWFQAVYDINASVGITFNTNDLVVYRDLNFTPNLPTTFGPPTSYTGQAFNYYFSAIPVPEPSSVALLGLVISGFAVRRAARRLSTCSKIR